MRKLATYFFAALLTLTGTAFAGGPTYQFVVIPATPTAGQPIQIQVIVGPGACNALPAVLGVEALPGNVVRFDLAGSDGCTQNLPAQQRTYDVGGFAAGQYVFRLADCGGNPPPGGDPCVTRSEQVIVIGGAAGVAQSVPAISKTGFVVLALIVLVMGTFVASRTAQA